MALGTADASTPPAKECPLNSAAHARDVSALAVEGTVTKLDLLDNLGYDTVRVDLPGCTTALPPLRNSRCGASEIGKSIDVNDVCFLLTALKDWVESGPAEAPSVRGDDWPRVRAVCVSRLGWPPPIRISSKQWPRAVLAQERPPASSALRLEAYIPNRSRIIFVEMSEQSRRLKYFAGLRDRPSTFIISDAGR
jgi:hypothetical protein